jgi:formylglycine-generating enzyme required for sulfatase activity
MRIFLSHASEDRQAAELIALALREQGLQVFFDRTDLPPGESFDARIRQAVQRADLLIFLLSPYAIDAGSYTLNELAIAQSVWPSPDRRVLPVVLGETPLDRIPPYLRAVTLFQPEGNITAAVAEAVHRFARRRRRTQMKIGGALAAGVGVVALGTWMYAANRGPRETITSSDGMQAVLVPAGSFTMGDDEESPRRKVYTDAFYMDKHEVTTAQYARFLEATGSVGEPEGWEDVKLDETGKLPVVGVDWNDADAYCRWAGRRLPTETEWEKAARGTDDRLYPWGDDPPDSARVHFGRTAPGGYQGGLANAGSSTGDTSPFGVRDMAANVSEWVADWYDDGFATNDLRNPVGPSTGTGRVIRGAGWDENEGRLKATMRFHASPDTRLDDLGFRCALGVSGRQHAGSGEISSPGLLR